MSKMVSPDVDSIEKEWDKTCVILLDVNKHTENDNNLKSFTNNL